MSFFSYNHKNEPVDFEFNDPLLGTNNSHLSIYSTLLSKLIFYLYLNKLNNRLNKINL